VFRPDGTNREILNAGEASPFVSSFGAGLGLVEGLVEQSWDWLSRVGIG